MVIVASTHVRDARARAHFKAQHTQLARTSCPGTIQVPRSD